MKITLYSVVILIFYTSILNGQNSDCDDFEARLKSYCRASTFQKDSIWSLMQKQHMNCVEEFYETIAFGWNSCFDEKEITQIRAILNDSLDLSKKYAIRAAGIYQATKHQYAIAKLADPDFFDELYNYFRYAYFNEEQPNPRVNLTQKKEPHIALANMGDTIVEDKLINVFLSIYDSLIIQLQESKDTIEIINNINTISTFLNKRLIKFLTPLETRRSLFKTLRMFDLDLNRDYFWPSQSHGHEHATVSCWYLDYIIFPKIEPYQMLDIRDNIYSNCWGVLPEEERLEFKKQKEQLIQDIRDGKIKLIPLIR